MPKNSESPYDAFPVGVSKIRNNVILSKAKNPRAFEPIGSKARETLHYVQGDMAKYILEVGHSLPCANLKIE